MKFFPLLYRYVFKEIRSPFYLCLFVFTGILFLIRSLKLVDLVINKDVPVLDIILLFSYIVPRFLEIAIPMSLLLAVIIAFSRLSADSELVVIRASGISIKKLAFPVIVFAIFACFATLIISCWIRPFANYRLGLGMFEIAKTRASSGLIPGVFNEMGNIIIYAKEINHDTKRLSTVILSDRQDEKNPRTFVAKNGHLVADNNQRTMSLYLYDGSIQEGFGKEVRFTEFHVNSISIDQEALVEGGPVDGGKKANEMYLGELISNISSLRGINAELSKEDRQKLTRYLVEFHFRFTIPVSCLCVAIVAMALGIQPSRGGKQWGLTANMIVGISIIFAYYLIMALADAVAIQSKFPPWLLSWSPDFLFFLLALFLFKQVGSEKWLAISESITASVIRLLCRLKLLERTGDSSLPT